MNQHLDLFQQWSKRPVVHYKKISNGKFCVVYTRVSSKEQYETNLSLDTQKRAIEEFAARNEFVIMGYFGGTYESASTDGRKEFQRMLEFIKKNKEKVTHILVYLLDRFSRTGDGAMRLSKELREKYGVTIIAVTQPIDTSNPGGVFQQNMQSCLVSMTTSYVGKEPLPEQKKSWKEVFGVYSHPWDIPS